MNIISLNKIILINLNSFNSFHQIKVLVDLLYSGNLNEQIHYAPQESERSVFTQGIYGTFFDPGFKVQILDYYMNN